MDHSKPTRSKPPGGDSAVRAYLTKVSQIRRVDPERERELVQALHGPCAEAARVARQELIEAHLWLVVVMSRRFEHRGLPLMDLVGEGNMALIEAVDRFDPRRNARLATYASWKIRKALGRAMAAQVNVIRMPTAVYEVRGRLSYVQGQLTQTLGRMPTIAEIAHEAKVDRSVVQAALEVPVVLSTDQETETGSLLDEIGASEDESPHVRYEKSVIRRGVRDALLDIPERDRTLLSMRFGLDGEEPATLETAGAVSGVSKERARQREKESLRRLAVRLDALRS